MKPVTKLIAYTAFALVTSSTMFINTADAMRTTPGKLNAEGWAACQALADRGYAAKIRGTEFQGRQSFSPFNIRYCFSNKQECHNFLNNIGRLIYPIEQISYARCKKR